MMPKLAFVSPSVTHCINSLSELDCVSCSAVLIFTHDNNEQKPTITAAIVCAALEKLPESERRLADPVLQAARIQFIASLRTDVNCHMIFHSV